jgi:hypothetical protein
MQSRGMQSRGMQSRGMQSRGMQSRGMQSRGMQFFAGSFTNGASLTDSAADTLSSFISKYQMRLLVRSAETHICRAFWAFRRAPESASGWSQAIPSSDTRFRRCSKVSGTTNTPATQPAAKSLRKFGRNSYMKSDAPTAREWLRVAKGRAWLGRSISRRRESQVGQRERERERERERDFLTGRSEELEIFLVCGARRVSGLARIRGRSRDTAMAAATCVRRESQAAARTPKILGFRSPSDL